MYQDESIFELEKEYSSQKAEQALKSRNRSDTPYNSSKGWGHHGIEEPQLMGEIIVDIARNESNGSVLDHGFTPWQLEKLNRELIDLKVDNT